MPPTPQTGRHGTGQYFEPAPAVRSAPRPITLLLPDVTLRLMTDRGVFSAGGVDPGTKRLLLDGPPLPAGAVDLLDLGCGYGPIALTLASRAPDSTVWAVDTNRRARVLCAHNADANGLANVRVAAPDEVPGSVRFAAIWSNPPIRVGKQALHRLLLRWFERLSPDGHALLVVHRHLGSDSLSRWLTDNGWPATRRSSRAGYRILEVRRP